MAKANKVKLPDGTYVSLNDERIHIYRSLTGTAAVTANPYTHAKWDVTDDTVAQYVDGMVVCIKVPVAGHGTYGTGLQINSLGYKPVVYNVSSMVSTRYSVGSVVWAVYNATQTASLYVNSASASTITGCWQVMDYDSNTTSIYTLQRYNGTRVVSADLLRYVIAFRKNETTIVPIHSVAGTGTSANTAVTSTNKTMTTESFDPFGEIYQYATNTKIAANESVNLSTLRTQCANVDARYIFNCNKTLTANRELYLVVDLQSDGMVKLATSINPWAQTLPSTDDGHLYILLGYAYSTYQMELYYYHPIYYHDGTQLRQYSGDKTGDTLPSQSGNSGKFLTTDGTSASWATVSAGSSTLSALTDTTITTPSDGQVLTYDNATSKWVNANAEKEIFWCTMTSTTENNTTTWSCDKTWSEIYAAHQAGKLVYLKKAQNDEIFTPFQIRSDRGFFSQCITISFFGNFFVAGSFEYNTNDGWTYTMSNALPIDVLSFFPTSYGTEGQVLTIGSGGNSMEWANVPTELPSITGNAGKVLTVNSGATGTEWTTPSGGATTLSALTDTTISSPTANQILTYDNTTSKWVNADVPTELPSVSGNASKILAVNNGATGVEWVTKPSSGLTNYDFTHTANTTVSGSTTTVTFAANTRGSAMLTISADLGLTIACNNGSDNYIWVKNTGSSEVDITISAVTKNSTNVSNVYVPSDGISVPAGGLCEIGVIVNTDGAFLTSRNDLAL